jgi:hypothetical protein
MDTKYRRPTATLDYGHLHGAQESAFVKRLRWEKAVKVSYERSQYPLGTRSPTEGGFQHNINVLQAVLKQIESPKDGNSQAVVDHYGLNKKDVTTAIEKLEALKSATSEKTHQKEDKYSLIAAGYAAYARRLDEKSHKAAKKRTPLSRPTPPPAPL